MTAYSPATRYSGSMTPMLRNLLSALALLVALAAPAHADISPDTGDLVYGSADAPVTIVEYAALTCPHCAHFYTETLPELKARYIDKGTVRLVFRDFPFEAVGLRAHMLARCAGPERRSGFMDVLFRQQKTWTSAPDPLKALAQIAKLGGMSDADFNACMTSKAAEEAVLKNRLDGEQKDKVTSTPTFIIGSETFSGARTIDDFAKVIEAAAAGKKAAPLAESKASTPASAPAPKAEPAGMTDRFMAWLRGLFS